jgi:hypothetical protein
MLIRKVASLKAGSIAKQVDLVEEMILLKVVIQLVERQRQSVIKSKVKCIKRKAPNELVGKKRSVNLLNLFYSHYF